jgi:DNA polymerase III epsilon subunit-like protein
MEFFPGELFYKPKNSGVDKFAGTYLFFDTETTGLPLNWSAPVGDLKNWPRLVQLAFEFYKNGIKTDSGNFIIRPEGFFIPEESSSIHGITNERAQKEGILLVVALKEFQNFVEQADYLVAHNMDFDEKIIGAEFLRCNFSNILAGKKTICTKEISTDFCKIPGFNGKVGYKWPKLSELHMKLFNCDFPDSHNAQADIEATAKCFWELKNRGVL